MKADPGLLERLYQTMVKIRRFDQKTTELFAAAVRSAR